MDKFLVSGTTKLQGEITVAGAKNVAMKVILAGLLTDKPLIVRNTPFISAVFGTAAIVKPLGVNVDVRKNHSLRIHSTGKGGYTVPLELGGLYRTATMVIGPLLARFGKAIVPNPGGCRLGKRPIDRHIEGLQAFGANVTYEDGFFVATAEKLHGARYRFSHNTHTGTETLLLTAVLATGETVLENAAEEPEIDDLIKLLCQMGAKIKRRGERTIVIQGVQALHGADFSIMPDRNEIVTFAIAALASDGDILVRNVQKQHITSFLTKLDAIGARWKQIDKHSMRFFRGKKPLRATNVTTAYHPGFMTDWQAPWAVLATQLAGTSTIHETIYEDRFGYVEELQKMGADIKWYDPIVKDPENFYNFNWSDRNAEKKQAIRITGPTSLHNGVLEVTDLRAGSTLVLAALLAPGESVIHGITHIDRGYEELEKRLQKLGARIKRVREGVVV